MDLSANQRKLIPEECQKRIMEGNIYTVDDLAMLLMPAQTNIPTQVLCMEMRPKWPSFNLTSPQLWLLS
jgi:hypothetical protein